MFFATTRRSYENKMDTKLCNVIGTNRPDGMIIGEKSQFCMTGAICACCQSPSATHPFDAVAMIWTAANKLVTRISFHLINNVEVVTRMLLDKHSL